MASFFMDEHNTGHTTALQNETTKAVHEGEFVGV